MVSADSLRNLFDSKIFDEFGLDATWKQKQSVDTDWDNPSDTTYSSGQTITIVPYDTFAQRMSFEDFGQMESGETKAAVRYSDEVQQDDYIEFDSKRYEVTEIEDNYLQKNLIKIITMNRVS